MWATSGPLSPRPDARHILGLPSLVRMLLPLLLLSWACGTPAGSVTLRLLKTTVFHNASSMATEGIALLGDLETYALDHSTRHIRFLQPWAHQGLSPKEWQDMETMIRQYLDKFILIMIKAVKDAGQSFPFVTQLSFGCAVRPNGTAQQFCNVAVNGEDFITLDLATGTCLAQQRDNLTLSLRDWCNQEKSVTLTMQFLLTTTCVTKLKTLVQYGKETLERQERPVAVVFARPPPPASPSAPWQLVCRVTGFYPRPVQVAWLQDGEEVGQGWRLDSGGTLPNADQTYQLRSSLAVGPDDGHSYACRVEHSSLGGRSLLIPWGRSRHWVPGLAVGLALGVVVMAAVGLWWRLRRRHPDARPGPSQD